MADSPLRGRGRPRGPRRWITGQRRGTVCVCVLDARSRLMLGAYRDRGIRRSDVFAACQTSTSLVRTRGPGPCHGTAAGRQSRCRVGRPPNLTGACLHPMSRAGTRGVVVVVRVRPTTGGGSWFLRAFVFAVLAGFAVVGLWLLPPDQIYVHAAEVTELATYPVLMAAAALLYVYYRLAPDAGAAWLATAAVFGTAQGLAFAAMRVVMEQRVPERSFWLLLMQVLVGGILVGLLFLLWRGAPAADPLGVGLCLAVAITVARLLVLERAGPSTSWEQLVPFLAASTLVLYGAMAVLLLRSDRLPAAATWRLGLVVVLLGTAQLLTFPIPPSDLRSLVAAALNVGGATVLALTAIHLVRTAMNHQAETEERVRILEGNVQVERTLLHEVAGSVAGISAATRLLTLRTGLGQGRTRSPDGAPHRRDRSDGPPDRRGPWPVRPAADLRRRPRRPRRAPPAGARDPRPLVAWHPAEPREASGRGATTWWRCSTCCWTTLRVTPRARSSPSRSRVAVTRWTCTVVDQGAGISPEIADSLLEWGAAGVLEWSGDRPQRRTAARHRHGRRCTSTPTPARAPA